ncbi:ABC transporter permease [Leucobacter sp. UCMA 4100]|uniref:ABC transporter permease n=1 Tax=Leucobacter sp. UCMA 4100 TaxID=2810534 RepID=UPI0022EA2C13|nr:ABC transporter permease [Leucobacter sp. UCMA 4100]MDA3147184.1 ABC transporter permease [Leucobacter sp. UCMA 4100]
MSVPRSRLRPADLAGLALHGVRAHPMRAILSGLGIAIGIAAMIAVIGISTSSQALVQQKLAEIGTNMLTVTAGKDYLGNETKLSPDAVPRVRHLDGVEAASWTSGLRSHVYRNPSIQEGATNGLVVRVAEQKLPETVGAALAQGSWFTSVTQEQDTVVLGSTTAEKLGITRVGMQVWLGDRFFTVIGILDPVLLAPELNTSAIVSSERATAVLGFDGIPTTIYERSDGADVLRVRERLPQTVDPSSPGDVKVSRPSDALSAKNTVDQVFTGMLVGVGSIALLVGGIGVANTMVITVLERRKEIGLRRSLGATRPHIRAQFLAEAVLLAFLGGLAGVLAGIGVTAVVALLNGWPLAVPAMIPIGGLAATIAVGAIAGVLPAIRASHTPPTAALSA